MIKIYQTVGNKLKLIDNPVENCWINMINPTEKELIEIEQRYLIESDDLRAALDEEEASRLTKEDNYSLILVDAPYYDEEETNRYDTIPFGMFITKDAFITICLRDVTSSLFKNKNKNKVIFDTKFKTRMALQILLEISQQYLKDLREINKQSVELESVLHSSIENAALLKMMGIGRSLLYFNTSLRGNSAVLEKLTKTAAIKKYEEDEDLLEDVIIESRQACEMCEVYNGVINGMMDAYSSIISNNMNVVQKFIAIASIVISIPSIIFDAYGMNLKEAGMPFANSTHGFILIILVAISSAILVQQYFKHKKMF